MMRRLPLAVLMGLTVACAERPLADTEHGGIEISAAFATASPTSHSSAAYFTIRNSVDRPDTLLALSVLGGRAQLHTIEVHEGRTSMQHVEHLAIAPGVEIRLVPGGYHVMLTDLAAPLAVGDTVELSAIFASADTIAVRAPVLTYSQVVERLDSENGRHP
jgi:copper(I)-binding protein